MSHRDTIESFHRIARTRSGKCLSTEYVNQRPPLKFECGEGHSWSATPTMVKGSPKKPGTWCKACGARNTAQKRMHTVEDMQRLADDADNKYGHKGGIFASLEYFGSNVKHLWRCHHYPAHPEFKMIPNAVQQGQWCIKCAGTAKPTLDEVGELARSRHPLAQCLSTVYKNTSTVLKWYCGVEEHPPFLKTYASVKHDRGWCKLCNKEKLRPTKFDGDFLDRLAKSAGGIRVSREPYKNTKQGHRWKCVDGHEFNRSLDYIFSARSFCPQCPKHGGIREQYIRELFLYSFNLSFERRRNLPWLVNGQQNAMELDGYNAELGLAFEHNGQQHYELDGYYAQHQHQLDKRINDNLLKKRLCEENGINLIIIPFNVPLVEIQSYVLGKLRDCGIVPPVIGTFEPGLARSSILEKLRQHAAKLEGRLLSDKYRGSSEKLLWQCRVLDHPPFRSSASEVISMGHWCDKCADDRASESYKVSAEQVQDWANRCNGELVLDIAQENIKRKFALSDEVQFRCMLCDRRPMRIIRQVKDGRLCFCRTKKTRIDRSSVEERLSKNQIRLIAPERIEGGKTRITIQCKRCENQWLSKVSIIMNSGIKCTKCDPAPNAGITIEKAFKIGEKVGFKLLSPGLQNGNTILSWECKNCGDHLDKPFREMRNVRGCKNCRQTESADRWKIA
jgi:hypothetical protein